MVGPGLGMIGYPVYVSSSNHCNETKSINFLNLIFRELATGYRSRDRREDNYFSDTY